MSKPSRSVSIGLREAFILAILAVVITGVALAPTTRTPLSSAETRFVEKSASGLQIVPASCESTPPYEHWQGECSGQPPEPPVKGCSMYAEPWHIAPGDGSTLTWAVGSYPMSGGYVVPSNMTINHGVGAVAESGSTVVYPDLTTTYRLSGSWESSLFHVYLGSFSCSYTVTVDNALCPAGEHHASEQRPDGSTQCVCDATGQPPVNGSCGPSICPAGQHIDVSKSNLCVCDMTNTFPVNGQCQVGQCQAQYYCSGPDRNGDGVDGDDLYVVNRNNMCSPAEKLDTCTWGCAGGGCVPAPAGSATLEANPRLLHSGDTTSVKWATQNVKPNTCEVVEDNPEINNTWAANSSAAAISGSLCPASGEGCRSGAIHMQTHYTLRNCVGLNGAALDPLTVEVNVIPSWEEQ